MIKSSSWRKSKVRIMFVLHTVLILAMGTTWSFARIRVSKSRRGTNVGTSGAEAVIIRDLEKESKNQDSNKLLVGNQPSERFVNNAELQIINKITGKVYKIRAKIDEPVVFERLEIIPLKCWKSFPEENPENKLLLRIFETNQHSRKKELIFYGWIFSSTPSVSGLEHSLYDVELKDCM